VVFAIRRSGGKITKKDWISKLERELGGCDDEIPKGFRTTQEWSVLWQKGWNSAEKIIRAHVKSGRMESKKFRRFRMISFYRAIK
jgi:hypothetical protein